MKALLLVAIILYGVGFVLIVKGSDKIAGIAAIILGVYVAFVAFTY